MRVRSWRESLFIALLGLTLHCTAQNTTYPGKPTVPNGDDEFIPYSGNVTVPCLFGFEEKQLTDADVAALPSDIASLVRFNGNVTASPGVFSSSSAAPL